MTDDDISTHMGDAIGLALELALFGPRQKPRRTALRLRGRSFEVVEIDDAGKIIEPPARCCYGVVLHAPNCKIGGGIS